MNGNRKDCPMRHENGNCTVAGGFCTAVNDPICEALHSAFDCGYRSAIRARQEVESKLKVVESNAPLTLDELRKMDGEPVYSTKKKQWFFIVHHRDSNSIALVDIWDAAYLPQSAMPLYRQKPEED